MTVGDSEIVRTRNTCPTCGQHCTANGTVSQSTSWPQARAGFAAGRSQRLHPIVKDAGNFLGSTAGGGVGAFYGWHHLMKRVEVWVPGRPLVQLLVGVPAVGVFAAASAGVGYALFVPLLDIGQKSYYCAAFGIRGAVQDLRGEKE